MKDTEKIGKSGFFRDGGYLAKTLPKFLILQVRTQKPGKDLGRPSHHLNTKLGSQLGPLFSSPELGFFQISCTDKSLAAHFSWLWFPPGRLADKNWGGIVSNPG